MIVTTGRLLSGGYRADISEIGMGIYGAWHKLELGEEVRETNLTFFDFNDTVSTSSSKLTALLLFHRAPLQHVRRSIDCRS
jgi:hypothetical protein